MVPHGEIGHHCRFKGLKVEEERKVTGKSDMKIGLKCKSNKTANIICDVCDPI